MKLTEHEAWVELLEGVKAGVVPSLPCDLLTCTDNHTATGMCDAVDIMHDMELVTRDTVVCMLQRIEREVRKKTFALGESRYLAPERDWQVRIPYLKKFVRETKPKRRTK